MAASSKVTRAQIEETLRRDHQHKETPDPGGARAHAGAALLPEKREAVGPPPGLSPEGRLTSREAVWAPQGEGWLGGVSAGLALITDGRGTHVCNDLRPRLTLVCALPGTQG